MRIGIFGGVFNPPHNGHLLIAQQVLDFTDIEEVWFLPNYGQEPPKPNVASAADRLAMTKMLVLPKTSVSSIEIDHKLDGNTIHLLPYLPREHTYTFILGADWLPSFHTWDDWKELLQQIPFLIFPRAGHPNEPLYENMKLLTHPLLVVSNLSATKIRERVKKGLSIDQLVPQSIAEYITTHGLYK